MLRCPFNNFSKCDGSCPFSTDNFNACKLASLLLTIEGLGRGTVSQLVTVNAHLVEVKDRIDALGTHAPESQKPTKRTTAKHPDQPRVRLSDLDGGGKGATLFIPPDIAERMEDALGRQVSYSVTASGEILVFAGSDRKLSRHGRNGGDAGIRSISMQSDATRLAGLYRSARVTYLKLVSDDGVFRFAPTGEVED